MSGWKRLPNIRLSRAVRLRYLERLAYSDPTDSEVVEMWRQRPRQSHIPEELDCSHEEFGGAEIPYCCIPRLEFHEYEFWRIKMRVALGSYLAVMDGLDFCCEHQWAIPDWLSERSINYLAILGSPLNLKLASNSRKLFHKEAKRLRTQQRALTVHSVLRSSRVQNGTQETQSNPLGSIKYSETVKKQASHEGINLDQKNMSIEDASEIASLLLRGTWAQAQPRTFRQAYIDAISEVRVILNVEALTQDQIKYLAWDIQHVRHSTIVALGFKPLKF